MGQQQILTILNNHYPKYMSYQEVMVYANRSKASVIRCLRQLVKCDDVEFKILIGHKKKAWRKTLYRSQRR